MKGGELNLLMLSPFVCLLSYRNLQDVEELLGLPPEKVLLKWMNFHLKKAGYSKQVTNFSSDLKVSTFTNYFMANTLCLNHRILSWHHLVIK